MQPVTQPARLYSTQSSEQAALDEAMQILVGAQRAFPMRSYDGDGVMHGIMLRRAPAAACAGP